LRALELLVVIDIYPTATAEFADWLLPATDQFERADIAASALGMQLTPWVQFTDPVVGPQHERREEWWIFARLAKELGLRSPLDSEDPEEAKWSRVDHMLAGSRLSRQILREQPRGRQLDVLPGGKDFFSESLQTRDHKVDCCPPSFAGAVERCADDFGSRSTVSADQLWLVSRRDSRMHNSWYANVPGMKRGDRATNRLAMHPHDATARGVADRQRVVLRSEWGEIEVEVQLDSQLRPQVVSLEHGWGMQRDLRVARATPGVNVNAVMPHGPGSFDPLSNQQFMTGVPVTVTLA
jgi:anaerobic selenocysteine-containing dehydrogenase